MPVLGPLVLSSHGFFFLVGAVVAFVFTRRRTDPRYHDALEDVLPWMTIGAILGARLLYVAQNPPLWTQPFEAVAVWKGGLVSYGGMVGSLAAWVLYLRRRGLPVWELSDAMAPAALLGWGLGRIGCLLSWYGEFGTVTDVPWAFVVDGVARHPVMLYLALGLATASAVVVVVSRRTGWSATGLALLLYGLIRATCDLWRYWDPPQLLYTSQGFSLFLALIGLVILVRRAKV